MGDRSFLDFYLPTIYAGSGTLCLCCYQDGTGEVQSKSKIEITPFDFEVRQHSAARDFASLRLVAESLQSRANTTAARE